MISNQLSVSSEQYFAKGANMKEKINDSKSKAFDFQLEMLKTEIQIIDKAIARLDEMTQTTKNWAILIWTGSVGLALGQKDLQEYLIFTAIVPFLFWLIDARWRYFLRGFIWREDEIANFINGNALENAINEKDLKGLRVLDPRGAEYRDKKEFKKKVNFLRSMKYPEVFLVYVGMMLMSIGMGIFFILR